MQKREERLTHESSTRPLSSLLSSRQTNRPFAHARILRITACNSPQQATCRAERASTFGHDPTSLYSNARATHVRPSSAVPLYHQHSVASALLMLLLYARHSQPKDGWSKVIPRTTKNTKHPGPARVVHCCCFTPAYFCSCGLTSGTKFYRHNLRLHFPTTLWYSTTLCLCNAPQSTGT